MNWVAGEEEDLGENVGTAKEHFPSQVSRSTPRAKFISFKVQPRLRMAERSRGRCVSVVYGTGGGFAAGAIQPLRCAAFNKHATHVALTQKSNQPMRLVQERLLNMEEKPAYVKA